MKKVSKIVSVMLCMTAMAMTSCKSDDEPEVPVNTSGIPSDDLASENPSIGSATTSIPNMQYTVEPDGDDAIIRLDMTGIQQAGSYDWMRLVGTAQDGQNVWLSVDGKPKGISVYNNADDNANAQVLSADLVFLVDNSGSMSQEANAIARDIKEWAVKLAASSLDIKFACVGYSEYGTINGAINFTDVESLSAFLDRYTGTSRTTGFVGEDAEILKNAADAMQRVYDECGGMALRYADANLTFRPGSNRIYVNFTDEPNQPNSNEDYSVEFFADQANWSTNQGTVHTVYSASPSFTERPLYREYPWRISEYTGGTILYASSNFSGVTLDSLPVTGAMTNSYVIRFTNVREFMDGNDHEVKITVLSTDGETRAERIFYMNFGVAQ